MEVGSTGSLHPYLHAAKQEGPEVAKQAGPEVASGAPWVGPVWGVEVFSPSPAIIVLYKHFVQH